MAKMKEGKKPLSQKRASALINPDEIFNSGLKIPPEVQARADKDGIELRWVDATELQRNNGQHKRGWMAYIRPKEDRVDAGHSFKFGNDPDGLIRRTSLILAYRPKAQGDKHRAFLQQRADVLSGTFRKKSLEEFRETARETGVEGVKVHEGYDDNDDE